MSNPDYGERILERMIFLFFIFKKENSYSGVSGSPFWTKNIFGWTNHSLCPKINEGINWSRNHFPAAPDKHLRRVDICLWVTPSSLIFCSSSSALHLPFWFCSHHFPPLLSWAISPCVCSSSLLKINQMNKSAVLLSGGCPFPPHSAFTWLSLWFRGSPWL